MFFSFAKTKFNVGLLRAEGKKNEKKKLTKKDEMYLPATRAQNINMIHAGIGSFNSFRAGGENPP